MRGVIDNRGNDLFTLVCNVTTLFSKVRKEALQMKGVWLSLLSTIITFIV